jgi:hypothetical protein
LTKLPGSGIKDDLNALEATTDLEYVWTGSPLFVLVAEHHLRTDLYLPRVLAMLGDDALGLIQEEDRELFACAFESRIDC